MPTGCYPRRPLSEETKRKISITKRGKPLSEATIAGFRKFQQTEKGKLIFLVNIRKAQESNTGRIHSVERRMHISNKQRQRYQKPEERIKTSICHRGEKNCNWKGGKTSENRRIRQSIEFRLWREAVFSRDNWTCQECGKRGVNLHPHHVKNFSMFPDLRFAIDNGITLCEICHQCKHRSIKLTEVSNGRG